MNTVKRLLVIAADGFEEIEMLAVVDIMRRLGLSVTVAALENQEIVGAHQITVKADTLLSAISAVDFDGVFLPGGMPGSLTLRNSAAVVAMIRDFAAADKTVSAICAAPIVLAAAGLLERRRFTMYPGFDEYLNGAVALNTSAECDGNIVTGRGPGAVFDFAYLLASALGMDDECKELYKGMFVRL